MIAFFGMGLLGSNFVRALRRRGEDVQVWNRTPGKASALEAEGARAFADPVLAVRGATRLHLTLSDDAAVDAVLEQVRPGLSPATVIVDHSTTSTQGTLVVDARLDDNFLMSARNVAGITLVASGRLTARDVMNTTRIIATRAAIERLQEVLG